MSTTSVVLIATFCSCCWFIIGLAFGAMLGGPKPPFKGGV